jgi:hypothetical protein
LYFLRMLRSVALFNNASLVAVFLIQGALSAFLAISTVWPSICRTIVFAALTKGFKRLFLTTGTADFRVQDWPPFRLRVCARLPMGMATETCER